MSFNIEIEPELSPTAWQPQYVDDTPKWYRKVFSPSPESAIEAMESLYPGWPKRIVPGF